MHWQRTYAQNLSDMHWKQTYARNLSEMNIYVVMQNEDVTWYNKVDLSPPTMHSHNMAAAMLARTAESLQLVTSRP